MAEPELLLFDENQRRTLEALLRALGKSLGGGGVTMSLSADGQLSVSLPKTRTPALGMREQTALVKLTAADATDKWKYQAEEVVGNDLDADPPTWGVKSPGRTFGTEEGDEGLVVHPRQVEGLADAGASGTAAPVYLVRRVVVDAASPTPPRWVIVGPSKAGPIAVKLIEDGTGSAGNLTTQCSFKYNVLDMAGNTLATGVDPIAAPHLCVRPAAGFRIAAKSGLATFETGELVLVMINETDDGEAC